MARVLTFIIVSVSLLALSGCSFISYKDPTKEVIYGEISKTSKIKKDPSFQAEKNQE